MQMENLKIEGRSVTLVDQVEDKLLDYFKQQDLKVGDAIPNETDLSAALGVARSVLRESLSRLKMMGMIESRTRRGMVLTEPFIFGGMEKVINPRMMSLTSLLDLLGLRIALEIGISDDIFHLITEQDIVELENIVNEGIALGNNVYANISEYSFHSKLYEITGNKMIIQFQGIIYPIINFVKTTLREQVEATNKELEAQGKIVTHKDLLNFIKNRDEKGYKNAIEQHFYVYKKLIYNKTALDELSKKDNSLPDTYLENRCIW